MEDDKKRNGNGEQRRRTILVIGKGDQAKGERETTKENNNRETEKIFLSFFLHICRFFFHSDRVVLYTRIVVVTQRHKI